MNNPITQADKLDEKAALIVQIYRQESDTPESEYTDRLEAMIRVALKKAAGLPDR